MAKFENILGHLSKISIILRYGLWRSHFFRSWAPFELKNLAVFVAVYGTERYHVETHGLLGRLQVTVISKPSCILFRDLASCNNNEVFSPVNFNNPKTRFVFHQILSYPADISDPKAFPRDDVHTVFFWGALWEAEISSTEISSSELSSQEISSY